MRLTGTKVIDLMINIIGATHPGQREHNEDCYTADAVLGLGLVADGMGGYACGEVASELVKLTIESAAANNEGLSEAIARAHNVVKDAAAADPGKQGMGSTAVAVKVQDFDYEIAWVGDSRGYLWDKKTGLLKQLTRDHSYVENLLSTGAISHEEAINHPNRNLITQAVGVAAEGGMEIGVVKGRLAPGQQLMICSDGLVDEVLDFDIAKILNQAADPEDALNNLIRAAVIAGGHDNITVVIVTVDERSSSALPPIEPQAVRSTSIHAVPDQPTQPRPPPSADITRMGAGAVYEVDDDDTAAPGALAVAIEFAADNAPILFVVAVIVGLAIAAAVFLL